MENGAYRKEHSNCKVSSSNPRSNVDGTLEDGLDVAIVVDAVAIVVVAGDIGIVVRDDVDDANDVTVGDLVIVAVFMLIITVLLFLTMAVLLLMMMVLLLPFMLLLRLLILLMALTSRS